jgi:hypothetical protein
MTFLLKDLVYFSIFIASVSAAWVAFKGRIASLEAQKSLTNKILFKSSGELRVMTEENCGIRTKSLVDELNKYQATTLELQKTVAKMNENIIVIMVHMKINKDGGKNDI